MTKKICVVTGSRAEFHLLRPLLDKIKKDFDLKLGVTGSHLDSRYGGTYQEIQQAGFKADIQVDIKLESDSPQHVGEALGRSVMGFSEGFAQLKPDLVVLLGDRYEILGVAQAALMQSLPIAHLFGGDITEGAFDDNIRHSITKMSHLHFVTNEPAKRRLANMGENPESVFNVGALNLDVINETQFLTKAQLEKELGRSFLSRNFLVTFHPETLATHSIETFQTLLKILNNDYGDVGLFFTAANADPTGLKINELAKEFCEKNKNASFHMSLGSQKYLSLMKLADAVIGNSSSGIYEAPVLKIPTVNIGDRQKGRLFAPSVFSCGVSSQDMKQAIELALKSDISDVTSPYGKPGAAEKITQILKSIPDFQRLVKKSFYESNR